MEISKNEINLIKEIKEIKFNTKDKIIFISDKNNSEQNNFLNFFLIHNLEIKLYSLSSNYFCEKTMKNELKNNQHLFFENIRTRLYTKFELSFHNINFEANEINIKKYFENENVSKKRDENYSTNLIQKKMNVKTELDNYKEGKTLEDEYFHLISLLIQDNTNKNIR